jgi:hypothetical protein
LLLEFPLSPPGGNVTNATGTKLQTFTKLKFLSAQDRIAFVKLEKDVSAGRKGALTFDPKYAGQVLPGVRADFVPIWWLPWSPGHMTKLKIDLHNVVPQDNTGGNLPNPSLFVTAALSGCSVFATGVPSAPSLYHGGLEANLTKFFEDRADSLTTFAPNQTAEEFWETVLNGVDNFVGAKPAINPLYDGNNQSMQLKVRLPGHVDKTAKATTKSINKSHYVNFNATRTTPAATAYEQFLNADPQNQRDFKIEMVAPWGAVIGIRDAAGNWKFYLQENATVSYYVFRKSTFLGWETGGNETIDIKIDMLRSETRVIRLTKFFPGAGTARPSGVPAVLPH